MRKKLFLFLGSCVISDPMLCFLELHDQVQIRFYVYQNSLLYIFIPINFYTSITLILYFFFSSTNTKILFFNNHIILKNELCENMISLLTKSVGTTLAIFNIWTPLVLRIWDFCFVNVSHSVCVSSAHDNGVGLAIYGRLERVAWI